MTIAPRALAKSLAIVAATAALSVVAACGSSLPSTPADSQAVAQTAAPTTTDSEPTESPESPVPTTPAQWTAFETCEAYVGDGADSSLMRRIPEVILSIGPQLDAATTERLLAINDELEEIISHAPSELATPLRSIQLPFKQVADVLEGGGGQLTLNTSTVQGAAFDLVKACAEAGYKVPSAR